MDYALLGGSKAVYLDRARRRLLSLPHTAAHKLYTARDRQLRLGFCRSDSGRLLRHWAMNLTHTRMLKEALQASVAWKRHNKDIHDGLNNARVDLPHHSRRDDHDND